MYYTYRGNKTPKPKPKAEPKHGSVTTMHGSIGVVLKQMRNERGWTVRDLSERAFMSTSHISEIERGLKEVSSSGIAALAKAFDTTVPTVLREAAFVIECEEIRIAESVRLLGTHSIRQPKCGARG